MAFVFRVSGNRGMAIIVERKLALDFHYVCLINEISSSCDIIVYHGKTYDDIVNSR